MNHRELKGSDGKVHLQLQQTFLDAVCRLLEDREVPNVGRVRTLRITPDKRRPNLLRIRVKLGRDFFQLVAEWLLFLRSLSQNGIEIRIDQTCATPADPRLVASFETRSPGITLAQTLVKEINNALKAENVIELRTEGAFYDPRPYKAFLTLNPFFLLKRLIDVFPSLGKWLPLQMVDHLTHIELKTSGGCLDLDFEVAT